MDVEVGDDDGDIARVGDSTDDDDEGKNESDDGDDGEGDAYVDGESDSRDE